MRIPLHTLALALALGLTAQLSRGQTRTHDLDDSYKATQKAANKGYFESQMGGDDRYLDAQLGQIPKDSALAQRLIRLLSTPQPGKNDGELEKVGFKELPYQPGHYVGWVFWGEKYLPKQSTFTPALLSVGFFVKEGEEPSLVAKPLIKRAMTMERVSLAGLDFAPYDLGPLGRAVGLRFYKNGCGAGGSLCATEYLQLLVVQQGRLTQILQEPIGYYGNYGGEWHKDGTREHIVEEASGILRVTTRQFNTLPVLEIKTRQNRKWLKKTLKAYSDAGVYRYRATGKEIIPVVD